jgi:hypothetical protein
MGGTRSPPRVKIWKLLQLRGPGKASLLRRLLGWVAAAILFGGLGILAVLGFVEGRQQAAVEAERAAPIKPPLRVTMPERGQPIVTIDAAAQKAIGLESAGAHAAPFQDQVRAFGTVLDLASLTTLNTNYVEAVSLLETAQARLMASRPAYERAQALYAKNIGSLVQVQTSEAALIGDKAAVATAQSKVRTLAATAIQEWGQVIGNGIVESSPLVSRLIERRVFLVQITVPPGVAVKPPEVAGVEMSGKDERIPIKYVSPATRTDPKIQGLSFFYVASGESGVLPGMNVRAFMASGKEVEGYVVPPSAVIWWSGRPWVYVRIEDDEFTRREIPTEMPYGSKGGYVVPASVFHEQRPQIVTKGAQMLLSEEFRSQIQVEGDDD